MDCLRLVFEDTIWRMGIVLILDLASGLSIKDFLEVLLAG